jgi:methyltransferase
LTPPPIAGLGFYLGALVVLRLHELRVSARNARLLRAEGAVESGRDHYPLLLAVHVLYPIALLVEVLALGARPPAWWPALVAVLVMAQIVRVWSMRALGVHWTTRVLVVPGAPRVRSGPYLFLSHPNYAAVVAELIAGPLIFGAWRTAIVISALNAVALTIRIRSENRALATAGSD